MNVNRRLEKLEGQISLSKEELLKYFFTVKEGEDFDKKMNAVVKSSKGLLSAKDYHFVEVNPKLCFPKDLKFEDIVIACSRKRKKSLEN